MTASTDWRRCPPEHAELIRTNADRIARVGTHRVRILFDSESPPGGSPIDMVCLELDPDSPAGMPAAVECDEVLSGIFPDYAAT
jgi:hypothetical protein